MIKAIELEDGWERISHTISIAGFLTNAIQDEVNRTNAIKALCEERLLSEIVKHIRFHHKLVNNTLVTTVEIISR